MFDRQSLTVQKFSKCSNMRLYADDVDFDKEARNNDDA